VGHLFPAEEGPDHVHTFEEPGVPFLLQRPGVSGHVLVQRLARPERGPETTREQVAERGDRLSGHGWVVALPGGGHHPERERRRLHRSAEPGPGMTRFPLTLAPRREVIRAHRGPEPGGLSGPCRLEEVGGRELLVRRMEPDGGHPGTVPGRGAIHAPDTDRGPGARGTLPSAA
jgi:hypothetical protein